MRRRLLLAASAGLLLDAVGRAGAQGRVPHLAYFWPGGSQNASDPTLQGFQAGLRDFGYREGQNIIVDYHYGNGDSARLAQLAATAVAAQPDVISTFGAFLPRTLEQLTRTIPIVSVCGDQVGLGLAKSFARPGGNVTGMALYASPELPQKWLQLLTEVLPGARRVAFLRSTQGSPAAHLKQIREAAVHLVKGLTIDDYVVRDASELAATLQKIRQAKADAILVDDDPLFGSLAAGIAAAGLPVFSGIPEPERAKDGWLLIYGPSIFDIVRRTGSFIDRILKGAKPGDLPIERPTHYYLTINLKAAQALGVTVPPLLLAQADEVIQ
jgi:putative tryptophan/tyrosine transport system substrate-binding protein